MTRFVVRFLMLAPFALAGVLASWSAYPQDVKPDRKDDLAAVLQASRSYSDTVAANCFADARAKLAERDAEIAKLKAEIDKAKAPAADAPQ